MCTKIDFAPTQEWGYIGARREDLNVASDIEPRIKRLAASVACVMLKTDLEKNIEIGGYVLKNSVHTLNERIIREYGSPLAEGEAFKNQLAPGIATAFLVNRRYLLTAGHVISKREKMTPLDKKMVDSFRFVFGFQQMDDKKCQSEFAKNDVYKGKVVEYCNNKKGGDFAIIKLNRKVDKSRLPFLLDFSKEVRAGDSLALLEHGNGIPLKVSYNAECKESIYSTAHRYHASLAASRASSGGAVIDARTGVVRGILVAGNINFEKKGSSVFRRHITENEISLFGYEQCQRITDPILIRKVKKYCKSKNHAFIL